MDYNKIKDDVNQKKFDQKNVYRSFAENTGAVKSMPLGKKSHTANVKKSMNNLDFCWGTRLIVVLWEQGWR